MISKHCHEKHNALCQYKQDGFIKRRFHFHQKITLYMALSSKGIIQVIETYKNDLA